MRFTVAITVLLALAVAHAHRAHAQADTLPSDADTSPSEADALPSEADTSPSDAAAPNVEPTPAPQSGLETPAEALVQTPEPAAGAAPEKPPKKPKERKTPAEKRAIAHTDAGVFGVKGRVFTEVRFQRAERVVVNSMGVPEPQDIDSLDIELDSARMGFLYQAPMRWLQAEIEIEIADPDQAELRDAYLVADDGRFSAKAGNFKLPTSAIELESAFTLPVADRGLIADLLEDFLDIGNRAPGILFGFEHRKGIEPKLYVGMFQGSVLVDHTGDDRDTELIEEANLDSQTWIARGALEFGDFDVGVFFAQHVGSPVVFQTQHYPVVGADVTYDEMLSGDFGFRFWVDAHYGESWYKHAARPESGNPWFLALRAILAARYGGAQDDTFFAEVYTQLGIFDPDLDVSSDWANDFSAGFNFGLWDRARLTLEGYLQDTARNFPMSYFGGPMGKRLGVTLQAALAF